MKKNIVLFCTAGMSTSLLVEKMKKAAEKENFECDINAYSMSKVKEYGPNADMILLGPQIRFNLDDVKSKCPNVPVEAINMLDYGTLNGEKVLLHVKKVLSEREGEN